MTSAIPTDFPLGRAGVDFLESRKVDIEVALRHLVHTVRADSERGIMVPDIRGTVLAFPFVDHGQIVNTKYRGTRTKKFWQAPGGTPTFYGADIMDDPAFLVTHHKDPENAQALTIVEGEIDKLAVETAGNPFVVSVPEGAPPPSKDHKLHEERSGSDEAGKFKFMWNNRERLQRIRRFVLAVDDDDPATVSGDQPLTIVEGEIDKLAVETAGNPFVVSVPEGAPPPSKDHKLHEERSGSDEAGKFKFMWNNRERLQRIRRFVLAVDDDDPATVSGDQPLTIVEGEIDKLAVETAGNPFVVSVPEGAPPPSKDHKLHEERSGSDEAGKFKFMWNNRERLNASQRWGRACKDPDEPRESIALAAAIAKGGHKTS